LPVEFETGVGSLAGVVVVDVVVITGVVVELVVVLDVITVEDVVVWLDGDSGEVKFSGRLTLKPG
jgi:hypothetical protein